MKADADPRLRLLDLDALEVRELQSLLPNGSYVIEKEQVSGYGDLGLTAAILLVVTPPVLSALAAWLLKKRQRTNISLSVEKIGSDKSVERQILVINQTGSEAPPAAVLRQLVTGLKLDPAILEQVLPGNQP
jgi:hypothetical protein